jgi:hypothetical protein
MKRRENESFEEYKKRRAVADKALKAYLKGKLFWDSSRRGTYVKADHDEWDGEGLFIAEVQVPR